MSDPNPPTPEELARQAQRHLESLRTAGVEWLPAAHTAPPPVRAAAPGVPTLSLFADPADGPAAGGPAMTDEPLSEERALEQRRQALVVLADQIETCSRCAELFSSRKQTVFGQGPPGAELCFIGEAPGA